MSSPSNLQPLKEQFMHLPRWLVRFSMPAMLVLTSAALGGWKWENAPLPF